MGIAAVLRYAAGASVASLTSTPNTPPGFTTVEFFDSNGGSIGTVQIPDGAPGPQGPPGTPGANDTSLLRILGGNTIDGTDRDIVDGNNTPTNLRVSTQGNKFTKDLQILHAGNNTDAPTTVTDLSGTLTSISLSGNDFAGTVAVINYGTAPSFSNVFKINFGNTFPIPPKTVILVPQNATANQCITSGNFLNVSAVTNAYFETSITGTLITGVSVWSYIVVY